MSENNGLELQARPSGETHCPRPQVGDLTAAAMAYGSYRGISFDIRCSSFAAINDLSSDKERWTFYLYLRQQQFNAGVWDDFWLTPEPSRYGSLRYSYPYMESEMIGRIDFHGGCTYYEKVAGVDDEWGVIKVGCDYSHYMDEDQKYQIQDILHDVFIAIDSLYEAVPDIKVFCCGNGGWYLAREGSFNESGRSFYSFQYQATMEDRKR